MKLRRPVANKYKISSSFGNRLVPDGKGGKVLKRHNGIDLACPVKVSVYAMADGIIVRCGWENPDNPQQGFGLRIIQQMKQNGVVYFLTYGHLSEIKVNEKDQVKSGFEIALSGATGCSRGAHLHVQARIGNTGLYENLTFDDLPEV